MWNKLEIICLRGTLAIEQKPEKFVYFLQNKGHDSSLDKSGITRNQMDIPWIINIDSDKSSQSKKKHMIH